MRVLSLRDAQQYIWVNTCLCFTGMRRINWSCWCACSESLSLSVWMVEMTETNNKQIIKSRVYLRISTGRERIRFEINFQKALGGIKSKRLKVLNEIKWILWYLLRVVAVISVQMFLNVLTVRRAVATVLFSPFYGVSDDSGTPAANTATTVSCREEGSGSCYYFSIHLLRLI